MSAPCVTLAELTLEPLVRVAGDTTLAEAARLLEQGGLGTLIVSFGPAGAVGVVTEREIVRAVAEGCDHDTPVDRIVTDEPLFVPRTATVQEALRSMLRLGRRSLVVVDEVDLRPLGFVTLPVAVAVLLEGPPWLGALKLALQIETTTS